VRKSLLRAAVLCFVAAVVLAGWLLASFGEAGSVPGGVETASLSGVAWATHQFVACEGPRHLIFDHSVPPGENWILTAIHAKNNSGPTAEINVAVYAEDIREWICLASKADAQKYDGVAWAGALHMGEKWQLGAWFRGAVEGDVLQFDATFTRHGVVITRSGKPAPLGAVTAPPIPYEKE